MKPQIEEDKRRTFMVTICDIVEPQNGFWYVDVSTERKAIVTLNGKEQIEAAIKSNCTNVS